MDTQQIDARYTKLLDETKRYTHGEWDREEFKGWGRDALGLIEELAGLTSQYYFTFLKVHNEAALMPPGDERFSTHVALCVSILKSVYKEHGAG